MRDTFLYMSNEACFSLCSPFSVIYQFNISISGVNNKPFRLFLAKITKFAKNIWEPVIDNIIILGHLMVNTSLKRQKVYIFCEICHIFTLY